MTNRNAVVKIVKSALIRASQNITPDFTGPAPLLYTGAVVRVPKGTHPAAESGDLVGAYYGSERLAIKDHNVPVMGIAEVAKASSKDITEVINSLSDYRALSLMRNLTRAVERALENQPQSENEEK
jgi:hypothetical protein